MQIVYGGYRSANRLLIARTTVRPEYIVVYDFRSLAFCPRQLNGHDFVIFFLSFIVYTNRLNRAYLKAVQNITKQK